MRRADPCRRPSCYGFVPHRWSRHHKLALDLATSAVLGALMVLFLVCLEAWFL